MMLWYLFGITLAISVFWMRWRYKNRNLLAMARKLNGPPALPGLGNALLFMCQPEEFVTVMHRLITEYGPVSKFWLGPDLNVLVSDPDEIKSLLSNPKTSFKGPLYKYMAEVTGEGILSGSGPAWRRHRKIVTPNFGKRAIEGYGEVFNKEAELLLEQFKDVQGSQQCNIYQYIVRTTSYCVCQTLMGLSKDQTINLPYIQYVIDESPRQYDIVFERMTKWYLQIDPVFWTTGYYQEQKKFLKHMTDFCKAIIGLSKLKSVEEYAETDLMKTENDSEENIKLSVIDRFLLSREIEDEELIKETFTIFTSSQEASAKITSSILLMMAYHPNCQEKLYREIKSVMGDEKRPVTEEDLKQMTYLEMVFKEVVRLFPIGAMMQRSINEDIPLKSFTLPAGCSLSIPVYHLHRDPRFWTRPDDFDPERFTPEIVKQRQPNCYIPFSLGQMDCIGRYYGTKLIKTICVMVMQEFKLSSPDSYKDLKLSIAISASPINGFHAILTPRNIEK